MGKLVLNAGDQIVFGRCKKNKEHAKLKDVDITIGKLYTLFDDGCGSLYFEDDVGDYDYSPDTHNQESADARMSFKITKIVK